MQKDISTLEQLKNRSIKISHNLRALPYTKELMRLITLEARSKWGGQLQKYKIEKDLYIINWYAVPERDKAKAGHRECIKLNIKLRFIQKQSSGQTCNPEQPNYSYYNNI